MDHKTKVLMVCVGNSCRSPMAEAILKSMVNTSDWLVDSAATADWNVGIGPEARCLQVLAEHNLTSTHIGRQITEMDFHRFDFIFGMDDYNMDDLRELAPKGEFKAKIDLLGNYDFDKTNIIHDPYFETGIGGFHRCYEQIFRCCRNFVAKQQTPKTN